MIGLFFSTGIGVGNRYIGTCIGIGIGIGKYIEV